MLEWTIVILFPLTDINIGLRIILFLPCLWIYSQDRKLVHMFLPYTWLFVNGIICIVKLAYLINYKYAQELEWMIDIASFVSVMCQVYL